MNKTEAKQKAELEARYIQQDYDVDLSGNSEMNSLIDDLAKVYENSEDDTEIQKEMRNLAHSYLEF